MRLHRLLGILTLIDSRGIMKAKELARILETSERTIYRDLDILCEAGFPLYSLSGPNGGYTFSEGYHLHATALESGDLLPLFLSSMGIRPEKNSEMAQQLQHAWSKLENSVLPEHKAEIQKARERFFIDTDPWWGKAEQNKNMDLIKKSVLEHRKLKIQYKKFTGQVSERTIRPYGAVVKNAEWYLTAFCETKKQIRVFKCSRIEQAHMLEATFPAEERFDLEAFWQTNKQNFIRKVAEPPVAALYLVKLATAQEAEALLKGFTIHTAVPTAQGWCYEVDLISQQTAFSVLLPLSDQVQILSPPQLRELILDKCRRILLLNEPSSPGTSE